MTFSLSDILFIIVIFQLLFMAFFLFSHKKAGRLSNSLLGALYLAICLNLADNFLLIKRFYFSYPALALWSVWMLLLFGPLLYLYTKSVLFRDYSLSGRKWLHFLPFITLTLVTEIGWQLKPRPAKLTILDHIYIRNIPAYQYWDIGFIFLHFFVYIAFSLLLIRHFRRRLGDRFSDLQRLNISWLSSTLLFFTIAMIVAALNGFMGLTPLANYFYFVFTIILLILFVYINVVILKAMQRPALFAGMKEEEPPAMGEVPPAMGIRKYAGSVLTPEESKGLLDRLQQHMQTTKPYLEPELTLEELSTQLSLRPKILSQVINENTGQNFFDFINRYRIGEAKRMLTDPTDKKITVQEVLYVVGFNSKSSFNTLFKKYTGLTPSEFKNKKGV
jgi:AraC-like DNA-binding protein